MNWAIRRRNGGVDINREMADDPSLFGPTYGEWIEVVRLSEVDALRWDLAEAWGKNIRYHKTLLRLAVAIEQAMAASDDLPIRLVDAWADAREVLDAQAERELPNSL